MKNSRAPLSSFLPFRSEYNKDLQTYVEGFMTEERKESLHKILENRTKHIVLVAENLFDEHNIHAMIRSSECLGIQDFYSMSKKNSLMKKNKVTRGALQWTDIYNFEDEQVPTKACIDNLRAKGYKVYSTSSNIETSITPFNISIDSPIAIIMGNEHEGVSPLALELSDGVIKIPMYGFTESYNVSVAASLLLQPLIERIRQSEINWRLTAIEKRDLYYKWIWYSIKYPDVLYNDWIVNNSLNK